MCRGGERTKEQQQQQQQQQQREEDEDEERKEKKDEKNAYAATVALPHTTFEMRANAVKKNL